MSLTPAQQKAKQNFLDKVMSPEQKSKQSQIEQSFNLPQGQSATQKTSPSRSSGGSRRSTPTPPPQTYTSDLLQQSFTSEQARATAETQFRQQQQQQSQQAQAQQQQQDIVVSTARGSTGAIGQLGRVQVGGDIFVGSSIVPGTGGMTADQYRREVERRAITEESTIDKKRIRKYDFTISEAPAQIIETKTQPVKVDFDFNSLIKGNQLIIPPFVDSSSKRISGMTKQDYGKIDMPSFQIYTQPTIIEKQIGVTNGIPDVGTFLVEPPKGAGLVTETRIYPSKRTPAGEVFEIEGFEPVTIGKDLEVISLTKTQRVAQSVGGLSSYEAIKGGAISSYDNLNIGLRESITEPTIGRIDFDKARRNVYSSTDFLISKGVPSSIAKTGEFASGFGLNLAENVKDQPAKYVVIGGVTFGAGLILGGVTAGATSGATAIGGAKAGLITGTSIKVATAGAGVYLGGQYASQTITRIQQAPTPFEKGGVLGIAFGETAVGVAGFRTGAKSFDKLRGVWQTKGRTSIDIPQGEYPTAPTRNQLGMFKDNLYPELGSKAGAFHTTSEVFWKSGKIIPSAGTSELPGLYGSTMISTPFSRIQGITSTTKFNLKNWFTNLFKVPGRPGVAYLQPEGFRYSPTTKTPTTIGEQTFSYKWKVPAKKGFADVPGIKTEIEAIFRPEAGGYGIATQQFYTTIKKVRVPIDSFTYDASIITSAEGTGALTLKGGARSYSSYRPTRVSSPNIPLVKTSTYSITSSTSYPLLVSQPSMVSSGISPSSSISYTSPTYTTSSVRGSSRSYSPSRSSSSISPSVSNAYSSIVSSSPSSKVSSSISPSSSISKLYSGSSSYKGSSSSMIPSSPKQPPILPLRLPTLGKMKQPRTGIFQVLGRRFGKFKVVGMGRTEKEAFGIGKDWAGKSLGATFKVPKAKARKLTGFKTKVTKEGKVLYIEPAKRRLKRGTGEIPEIQMFRRVKGGKKK